MRKIFLYILLAIFMVGCEKDNFESKPSLKINSISANKIFAGEDLQIKLQLSDLEGDVLDTIWIKKTNKKCIANNLIDSGLLRIPADLPRTKNFNVEMIIKLEYNIFFSPSLNCFSSDTTTFSFWVKDEKGNKSDTVKTSPIIISR